jgi:RecB family exonuclease
VSAANLRVLEGGPGDGRVEQLEQALAERLAEGRADTVMMLVPSDAARRRVIDRLHRRGRQGFFEVPVFTLFSFVERLHLTRPLPGTRLAAEEQQLVLADLLRAGGALAELADRPGAVRSLARCIARIKRQGVYRSAQVRELLPSWRASAPRADTLLAVFDRYQQVLESRGLYDPEGILFEATDPRRRGELRLEAVVPRPELLLVALPCRIGGLERLVLERLIDRFDETVWAQDVDPVDGALAPCGFLAPERDWVRGLHGRVTVARAPATRPSAQLTIARHTSRTQEVAAIARALAALPASERAEAAVVLFTPDDYLALIGEMFPRFGVAGHVPAGAPLIANPLFAPIALLLDLLERGLEREGVASLIAHPLVRIESEGAPLRHVDQLVQLLRKARLPARESLALEEWREHLRLLSARAERQCETWPAESGPPRALAREIEILAAEGARLLEFLSRWPRPDERLAATQIVSVFEAMLAATHLETSLPRERGGLDRAAIERCSRGMSAVLDALHAYRRAAIASQGGAKPVAVHAAQLRALLESVRVPGSRPLGAVSVLSAHEVLLGRYRHVFVPGLSADVLPLPAERDAFLGEAEASRLGLLSTEDRLAQARYFLVALRAETEVRVALSHAARDGLRELLRSPLLDEQECGETQVMPAAGLTLGEAAQEIGACWRAGIEAPHALAPLARELAASPADLLRGAAAERSRARPELGDHDGVLQGAARAHVEALLAAPGRAFSARAIEHFAHCPMKFLFADLLDLRGEENVELEVSRLDRGSLVHRILARFYGGEEGARLAALKGSGEFAELARQRLLELADEALEELPQGGVFRESARADLRRGLAEAAIRLGPLARFLKIEQERLPGTRPSLVEASFGLAASPETGVCLQEQAVHLVIAHDGRTVELRLRGRIDRVDRVGREESQHLVLIDYKTGMERSRAALGQLSLDLQLPLYTLAAQSLRPGERVVGAFDVDLARGTKHQVVPVVGDPAALALAKLPNRNVKTLDTYRQRLVEVVLAARAGAFHTTRLELPSGAPCRYCDFRQACRGPDGRARIARLAKEGRAFPSILSEELAATQED